jgi:hypothetical protein
MSLGLRISVWAVASITACTGDGKANTNGDANTIWLIVVVLGTLAAVAGWGWRRIRAQQGVPSPHAQTSADCEQIVNKIREQTGTSPLERREFIREQVRAHQWAYLRYEVGLLAVKHRLSADAVRALLNGEGPRDAAPTLALATDRWAWRAGEVERLILEEAGALGLQVPSGGSLIDARASRACRDWARARAAELVAPLRPGGGET